MELYTSEIIDNDVLGSLADLSSFDCDFIGENGDEYLREEAKGFNSNRDYILDKCSHIDDVDALVDEFFDFWMAHDSYYVDYQYSLIKDEDGKPIAITLAYITD